jgi:hypothetical protein
LRDALFYPGAPLPRSVTCAEDLIRPDDDPAAILELHDHLPGEDFQGQDPAFSPRREDPRADGRQITLEGLVGVKFVPQTTF